MKKSEIKAKINALLERAEDDMDYPYYEEICKLFREPKFNELLNQKVRGIDIKFYALYIKCSSILIQNFSKNPNILKLFKPYAITKGLNLPFTKTTGLRQTLADVPFRCSEVMKNLVAEFGEVEANAIMASFLSCVDTQFVLGVHEDVLCKDSDVVTISQLHEWIFDEFQTFCDYTTDQIQERIEK